MQGSPTTNMTAFSPAIDLDTDSTELIQLLQMMSDRELLTSTKSLAHFERKILTQVLHHLYEVNRRRLYSALKHKNLAEYTMKELGYSESEAYRRIDAMHAIQELPELEEKLAEGTISLTNLSMAQVFFRAEEKVENKFDKEEKLEFIGMLENKSSREAQKVIFKCSSQPKELVKEGLRLVSEDTYEMKYPIDESQKEVTDTLKGLLAHSHPNLTLQELYRMLCELGLREWDPSRKVTKRKSSDKDLVKRKMKTQTKGFAKLRNNVQDKSTSSSTNGAVTEASAEKIAAESSSKKNPASRRDVSVAQWKLCVKDGNIETFEEEYADEIFAFELGVQKQMASNMSSAQKKSSIPTPNSNRSPTPNYDPIPAAIEREVWQRAQSKCENCGSTYALQIDHVIARAKGGSNKLENLRLLCRSCNQRAAIETFGGKAMRRYLH